MKYLSWLLVGCLLAKSAIAQDWEKIASSTRPSTVYLEATIVTGPTGAVFKRVGTGFVVHPRGYFLTAYHTIASKKCDEGWFPAGTVCTVDRIENLQASIGSRNAMKEPVFVFRKNEEFDLALMYFANNMNQRNVLPRGDPWGVASGARLGVSGFPVGLDYVIREGILGSIQGPNNSWILGLSISPGDSGAALLNKEGKVVGIAIGALAADQKLGVGVPLNFANDLLVFLGIPIAPQVVALANQIKGFGKRLHVSYRIGEPRVSVSPNSVVKDLKGIPIPEPPVPESSNPGDRQKIIRIFEAQPGYTIVSAGLSNAKSENVSNIVVTPIDGGRKVRIEAMAYPQQGTSFLEGMVETIQVKAGFKDKIQ